MRTVERSGFSFLSEPTAVPGASWAAPEYSSREVLVRP
jgi:hypothetical protein